LHANSSPTQDPKKAGFFHEFQDFHDAAFASTSNRRSAPSRDHAGGSSSAADAAKIAGEFTGRRTTEAIAGPTIHGVGNSMSKGRLLDAQTWAEAIAAIIEQTRAVQAELRTAANKAGKKKR
jgi:hypothetical protein